MRGVKKRERQHREGVEKKRKEGKPRERDRELFGEKQGDRNREKKQ
jgi:hypothetical protein